MKDRIGIVGGGQLGRMLGIAAKQLGFRVTIIDPTPHSPAGQVVDEQIIADFTDEVAIRALAARIDFLTFEVELANSLVLEEVAKKGTIVHPFASTLGLIKDKYMQKKFLEECRIPTAKSLSVVSYEDIKTAAKKFGYPLLLKARRDAYDGRGNALIKNPKGIKKAMEKLSGRALYIEQFVPFVKELAIMVVRSSTGEIRTYPVVETIHKNNICHTVIAPAQIDSSILKKAELLARKVMKELKGAGVFGIEMFLTSKDKILINEIAPRVHNSGHYTIEACMTSQFEQHIRAITGLPLGSTQMKVPTAVMVNILGDRIAPVELQGFSQALSIPNVTVHIYGKQDTKPERKMGHITVVDSNWKKAYKKAKQARRLLSI